MEEADPGDSGGSGLQAGGSIFGGDASEGVDGSRICGETNRVEGFETLAVSDDLACNGFLEDWSEEDEIHLIARLCDFSQGVTGDGDDGRRELSGDVKFSDLGGSELAWSGGEVDSVGSNGDGYIRA